MAKKKADGEPVKNIHEHHRARMKEQYAKFGPKIFHEHQILELLLFFCLPRRDTNPLAHELINHFGSLRGVLMASEEELASIKGIGSKSAGFIKLIPEICRRYDEEQSLPRESLNPWNLESYLRARFSPEFVGKCTAIFMNGLNNILCCKELSIDLIGNYKEGFKTILKLAISNRATSLILAYYLNKSSAPDIARLAEKVALLKEAVHEYDLELEECVVILDDRYISMKKYNCI